jgi:hypothetical protein
MHKLISAVALFAFAGALFAESPFTETWKLDAAKTKYGWRGAEGSHAGD